MFALLAVVFLVSSALAYWAFTGADPAFSTYLPVSGLAFLGMAPVVAQWVTRRGVVRDFFQGGYVGVVRDDPYRLVWQDWAILVSRRGTLDRRRAQVRVERRLFYGLIPCGAEVRSLDEFRRVELDRNSSSFAPSGGSNTGRQSVWNWSRGGLGKTDYRLNLVNHQARRFTLLDLSTMSKSGIRFATELRDRLDEDLTAYWHPDPLNH